MYPDPIHFENGSRLLFRETSDPLSGGLGPEGVGLTVAVVSDHSGAHPTGSLVAVDSGAIAGPDLATLEPLLARIRAVLRNSPVEFAFRAAEAEAAQSLAAMLIVTVRVLKQAGPEYAIRSVTGRTSLVPSDEPVLAFYRARRGVATTIPEAAPPAVIEPPVAVEVPTKTEYLPPEIPGDKPPQPTAVPVQSAPQSKPAGPAPGEFRLSRIFTIRNKLLGMTSAIIIAAMVTMIVVASGAFNRQTVTLVQSNNLTRASTLGSKADFEFEGLVSGAELLIAGGGGAGLRESYFSRNPRVLFAGRAVRLPNSFAFSQKYYNDQRLAADELSRAQVDTLLTLHGDRFLKAFNGASVVENVSPGFPTPVLGVARPTGAAGDVLLVFLDMRDFLKAFGAGEGEQSQLERSFLVNASGEVVAHPDLQLVRARANVGSLSIVKRLLTAKEVEGQTEYTDEKKITWTGAYKKLTFDPNVGVVAAARNDLVYEPARRLQRNNIYVLVIAVNVALLIVFFFARAMTVPIRRLVEATEQIEAGNYHVNVPPTTRDEVGLLTSSFGNMARGLDERERMKDAFGKFVNKEIAERVLRGEVKLGGEKKHCAIFFSDLRGFTAMSEGLLPEQVVDFLNGYFTGMVRCVNETHGVVDKFIGDAIMAHWGAVVSRGNDTENAVNAALMMRRTLIEFNKSRPEGSPKAKMGCGINTGPVIAGQIGSDERLEFTVIGDAVNLASRIEALNKPFGTDILISSDSLEAVPDLFHVTEMPAIKVKGKTEPQHVYAVLGRRDDPQAPKDLRAVRAMVGIDFDDSKMPEAVEGEEVKYEILDESKKK